MGFHPTTHILKPSPERFKYLSENEWFQARLAQGMGLNVAPSKLIKIGKAYCLLVTRYDRYQAENEWMRLHQEDFCQALGVSGRKKYQKEGGPSFLDCINIINERSFYPLEDIDSLLRWQIFNLLIGNCDAHAKNISLLRGAKGHWRLAPFYDLVATKVYPDLSSQLAMAVGSQYDSGMTQASHWQSLFKKCQVSPTQYSQILIKMLQIFPSKIKLTQQQFIKEYGESPILERLDKVYNAQIRHLQNGFKKIELK